MEIEVKKNLRLFKTKESIKDLQGESVRFLQRNYHWDRHQALTIYHDACLLVMQQLEDGNIQQVTKPYLLKVCKNLGANAYRKTLKEKERLLAYWTSAQEEYQNDIQTSYGITIFDSQEEDYGGKCQKALRAFSMLDEKCQQIIPLKYVYGQSHNSIAEKSDYVNTPNSAKTVLGRCLKYWRRLNEKLSA